MLSDFLRRLHLYSSYLLHDSIRNNWFRLRFHVPVWHGEKWQSPFQVHQWWQWLDHLSWPKSRVAILLSGEGQSAEASIARQTVPPQIATDNPSLIEHELICLHLRRDMQLSPRAVRILSRQSGHGKKVLYYFDEIYTNSDGTMYPCLKPDWCPENYAQADYIGPCYATVGMSAALSLDESIASADHIIHIPTALIRVQRKQGKDPAPPWKIHPCTPMLPRNQPLVSILIPTKDHATLLRRCLNSICQRTTWPRWEIILIDNGSTDPETLKLYQHLHDERIHIMEAPGAFNFSRLNNWAAKQAHGDYLLLLNNDTEILSPNWIEALLAYASQPQIGAVGGLLTYPDGDIQHAGIGLKIAYRAGHIFRGEPSDVPGYQHWIALSRNVSAVTGACMMVRRSLWERVHGLDEDLAVAYNDVDFCLRLGAMGYRCVYTPDCHILHDESRSRGADTTGEQQKRFNREAKQFEKRWKTLLRKGDPCLNPGFCFDCEKINFR